MESKEGTASSIGERIREKRETLKLSSTRLAEAAGISRSYLHEIENNPNVMPSAEVLFNIAEVLETSVAVLLGKRRNPTQRNEGVEIPASLAAYADAASLSEEEVQRLACIKYRNRQPKNEEDWAFIHEAIKRAIGDGKR